MLYPLIQAKLSMLEPFIMNANIGRLLKKYNILLEPNDIRLFYLQEIFSGNASKVIVEAVSYVILAHDIHEVIDEPMDDYQLTEKERELLVLAGDYYSALYYRLLVNQQSIDLLPIIQSGVEATNTAKANIYQLHSQNESVYLADLVDASSSILTRIAMSYQEETNFLEMMKVTILLQRLLAERSLYRRTQTSSLLKAYRHGYFVSARVNHFFDWLKELINIVEAQVDQAALLTKQWSKERQDRVEKAVAVLRKKVVE